MEVCPPLHARVCQPSSPRPIYPSDTSAPMIDCLFVRFIASQHTLNQLGLQHYTTPTVYVSSKLPSRHCPALHILLLPCTPSLDQDVSACIIHGWSAWTHPHVFERWLPCLLLQSVTLMRSERTAHTHTHSHSHSHSHQRQICIGEAHILRVILPLIRRLDGSFAFRIRS